MTSTHHALFTGQASGALRAVLAALIAAAPEGYVATDGDGAIRHMNAAFLNLAQLATEEQALGARAPAAPTA